MPFAAGDMSRTLTVTALDDADGLSEVLTIALATSGITGYTVTAADSATEAATRTLTMTDTEPLLTFTLTDGLDGTVILTNEVEEFNNFDNKYYQTIYRGYSFTTRVP